MPSSTRSTRISRHTLSDLSEPIRAFNIVLISSCCFGIEITRISKSATSASKPDECLKYRGLRFGEPGVVIGGAFQKASDLTGRL